MYLLEDLLQEYNPYIYRFAYYLTTTRDDAQELTQRTWIQVWKHLHQLQDPSSMKAWMRTICLNEFRSMVRSTHNIQSLEALEEDGKQFTQTLIPVLDEIVVTEEVENMRNGCFLAMSRKLSLPQRIAYCCVDMFGLTIAECAILMKYSYASVKGLLFRARNNLASFFSGHCKFMKDENTCHCTSWIAFTQHRAKLQQTVKTSFSILKFQEKDYRYQKEVQEKLLYYYQRIPTKAPDTQWYEQMIEIIKTSFTSKTL